MIPDGLHILIRLSGRRIIVSTSTCSIVIILVKSKNQMDFIIFVGISQLQCIGNGQVDRWKDEKLDGKDQGTYKDPESVMGAGYTGISGEGI